MPEKILVRATNWVGDLVMSTPAMAAIRDEFPDAHISVLVKPPLDELLAGNPAVDEIIRYDRKMYNGATGIVKLAGELRKKRFDRAILLQNAFEAAVIAFMAKIPVRMGYATDGRGILLTKSVKVAKETKEKHQVYYYLDLLKALGMKAHAHAPKLYPDREHARHASEFLKENGVSGSSPVVGINPGAQYGVAKKWYPERYADVADRLVREYGARVVIFGGPGDVAAAGTVEAAMREPAINLAGRTTIRELMAYAKKCGLFITNDTGAMHVSAALGVPTLAVFGSTDHIATGPFGKGNVIVRNPVNCSPCLKRTCPLKHYRCMETVSADQVYEAAKGMLEGGRE
ncbi:MAG TPA: lipopolysaccharide heptosyltransferase II [Nitrospirota bacterium]